MDGQHHSLQKLSIQNSCDSVTSFSLLDAFPNLKDVGIIKCEKMESIVLLYFLLEPTLLKIETFGFGIYFLEISWSWFSLKDSCWYILLQTYSCFFEIFEFDLNVSYATILIPQYFAVQKKKFTAMGERPP
ncbi:hypothetical protein Ahy_A02g005710 [Arachis hypogaea]|uniref:Uncharacterized protein n=1 Tax=Arachis hypogaea TaxID=3818 RepID=A0A445E7M4_ARAHY|nr:hypothetical protein Ahy_A02g005710 [Arachis hypogaea]